MHVVRFNTFEELTPYAEQWDRVNGSMPDGGVPFRGWDWASTWWQYYGSHWHASRILCVLGVVDELDNLIAVAPLYMERSVSLGRVLRFLGDGEVCGEHLDIIIQSGRENEAIIALADWFVAELSEQADLVELSAVDAQPSNTHKLAELLSGEICTTYHRAAYPCWQINLPASIDEYLARLSKGGRKSYRRINRRMFDSGRARLRTAANLEEAAEFMEILIDLHKRRFSVAGRLTSNCTDRFWNFHRDVVQKLFAVGNARLHVLDIDGVPAAAEYQFSAGDRLYAYQSGIDPERLDVSPGSVAMAAVVDWAISQGYRSFDFLRGNEPYKAHWRAGPKACVEIRMVPNTMAPQLRHNIWLAGSSTYNWLKEGVRQIVPSTGE